MGTGPARRSWSCLRPAVEGAHSQWPPLREARGRTTQPEVCSLRAGGSSRPRASAGRDGQGEKPTGSFRKRRADTPPATAQREETGGKGHWSQEGVPTPVPSEAEEASVLSVKCQHLTPMCLPADGEAPSWSSGSSEIGQRACVLTDPQGTAGSVVLSSHQYGGHRTPPWSPPGLHGNTDGGMNWTCPQPQCQAPVFCATCLIPLEEGAWPTARWDVEACRRLSRPG